MKDKTYRIALRRREGSFFWKETEYCFIEYKPMGFRYWQADPFLFEIDGKTYLFFEQFDRFTKRGYIAYSEVFDENTVSEPKIIIREKYHLSFPYVFKEDSEIYLMPESCETEKIFLYKAVNFPDNWIKQEILDHVFSCDSIWIFDKKEKYGLITSEMFMPEYPNTLQSCYVQNRLFRLDGHFPELEKNGSVIATGDYGIRNAGACFYDGEKQIRPGQDCTEKRYGNGIVLFETLSIQPYEEQAICNFSKEMLEKHLIRQGKEKLLGTHTYNISSKYEVVDFAFIEDLGFFQSIILSVFRWMFTMVIKLKHLKWRIRSLLHH